MPEGHIVHAEARRFTETMAGEVVRAESPQGRFTAGALCLDGRTLESAEAYGKHLFLRFTSDADGPYLHVHLGLIGTWSWHHPTTTPASRGTANRPVATPDTPGHTHTAAGPPATVGTPGHTHTAVGPPVIADTPGRTRPMAHPPTPQDTNVRLRLTVPHGPSADLRAPMTCAILTPHAAQAITTTLGPDPLRSPLAESALQSASPTEGALQPVDSRAWERVRRSGRAIGALLLDQTVVAGAGLIWRCEAPFLAGISPYRPGRDLTVEDWTTLWHELSRIMRAAVAWGGPADAPAPTDGHRTLADTFHVFRRDGQPCRLCHAPIQVAPLNGRKVWWCPHHQPH